MKRELIDLEDGEIIEDEYRKDIKKVLCESTAPSRRTSCHDQNPVSDGIRSGSGSHISKRRKNQNPNAEGEGRPIDNRLQILRVFEKEKLGKHIGMDFTEEKKNSTGATNDQKGSERIREPIEKRIKTERCEEISEVPDDEWIFESLGETHEATSMQCTSKSIDNFAIRRLELETERMKLLNDRKKMEEIFAKEKKQLAANLYTLLVTARYQINMLNADKQSLIDKLEGNSSVKCPSCGHFFSTTKNLLRPKHIHVTKGTNAVELRFENFDVLRRWLNLSNLDRGIDGLPVWMESESKVLTLASTNSSIMATTDIKNTQDRKLVDVTKSVSNAETCSKNPPVTTVKPAVHEGRSVIKSESRRHNFTSMDSAVRRGVKAKITEKCKAIECPRPGTSKAKDDRGRGSAILEDRKVAHHVVDKRRRFCERIRKRSRSPISGRIFFPAGRDRRKRHADR